jgi:parallel beta-helix repeat protein
MKRLMMAVPAIAAVFVGCSDDSSTDATVRPDAGEVRDATADAASIDAFTPDAMEEMDAGSTDTGTVGAGFPRLDCSTINGRCVQFEAHETNALLDTLNTLESNTTIILGAGVFRLENALTIRGASDITLTGQGIDVTTIDFAMQPAQANGVDVIGDRFLVSELSIVDSKKDGLRIENSTDVVIRKVKVSWSRGPDTMNGSYAIYPVRCTNVLLEDSEAYGASDAGLYVGQSINVVVRRNIAKQNVAGLEIENTQFADVYENTVEDNTGGLLIFDLPGNPVIARDVRIHDNIIRDNNRPNFALAGTTVSNIPKGTGTFTLASRRVEIADNTYEENGSTDIAILSGLAVEDSTTAWAILESDVRGSTVGLSLIRADGAVLNYYTNEIWIHGNTHMGSGTSPDNGSQEDRPLGALLFLLYYLGGGTGPVDNILYDGIGEVVDPDVAANNSNYNHICVENEVNATWATLDLPKLVAMIDNGQFPSTRDLYRPPPPFVPFNCSGFTEGPIPEIVLPFDR